MSEIIEVPNKNALEALQNHNEGEIAFCKDEGMYYSYTNGEWVPVPIEKDKNGEIHLNLYALNKQIVAQLPPFDIQRLEDAKDTLNNWKKEETPYLLYGNEISYFTLFWLNKNNPEGGDFADNVFDCLSSLTNTIYSLDVVNEDVIEIWIGYEDEATVLYLFNYNNGVVYYYE